VSLEMVTIYLSGLSNAVRHCSDVSENRLIWIAQSDKHSDTTTCQ